MKIEIFDSNIAPEALRKTYSKVESLFKEKPIESNLIFLPYAILEYTTRNKKYRLCIEAGPLCSKSDYLWLASIRNNYIERKIITVDLAYLSRKLKEFNIILLESIKEDCNTIIKKILRFKKEVASKLYRQTREYLSLAKKYGLRNMMFGLLPTNIYLSRKKEENREYSENLLIQAILKNMNIDSETIVQKCRKPIYQPFLLYKTKERRKVYVILSKKIVDDQFFSELIKYISV